MPKTHSVGDIVVMLRIDEIKDAIDSTIDAAMFDGGEVILDAAKPGVPVLSGDTRDSGYVATKSKSTWQSRRENVRWRKELKLGEAVVGFANFKAHWLEYGTRKMAARPFLRPAFDSNKGKATETIVAALRKALK